MARYNYTRQAESDLGEVWEYIARDNVRAADRTRERIINAIERLAEMPELGQRVDLEGFEHLRFWTVRKRYVIVYDPATKPLLVHRIFSGERDWQSLLSVRS